MKPPDLQELVERSGGYDRITPEEWRKFDAQLAVYRSFTRGPVSQIIAASNKDSAKPRR